MIVYCLNTVWKAILFEHLMIMEVILNEQEREMQGYVENKRKREGGVEREG